MSRKKIGLIVTSLICLIVTLAFLYLVSLYRRSLMGYTDFLLYSNFLSMTVTFTVLIFAVLVMRKSNTERYHERFRNQSENDSEEK